MNINVANSNPPLASYVKKNPNINTSSGTGSTFSNLLSTKDVQESKIQQANSSDIWEKLSDKYDIRKATFEEVTDISLALYNAGEISFMELGLLTFDYDKATKDVIRNAHNSGIQVSPNFSMYETEANESGQRDWIAEFEARVSKSFQYDDLVGYQNNKKVLKVLQKLQHSVPQKMINFDDEGKSN